MVQTAYPPELCPLGVLSESRCQSRRESPKPVLSPVQASCQAVIRVTSFISTSISTSIRLSKFLLDLVLQMPVVPQIGAASFCFHQPGSGCPIIRHSSFLQCSSNVPFPSPNVLINYRIPFIDLLPSFLATPSWWSIFFCIKAAWSSFFRIKVG